MSCLVTEKQSMRFRLRLHVFELHCSVDAVQECHSKDWNKIIASYVHTMTSSFISRDRFSLAVEKRSFLISNVIHASINRLGYAIKSVNSLVIWTGAVDEWVAMNWSRGEFKYTTLFFTIFCYINKDVLDTERANKLKEPLFFSDTAAN